MRNYLLYIILFIILISWFIFIKYLLPYLQKKKYLIIQKRDIFLLFLLVLLMLVAFLFTYIETNGTFILGK
jgi:hypothetical protein